MLYCFKPYHYFLHQTTLKYIIRHLIIKKIQPPPYTTTHNTTQQDTTPHHTTPYHIRPSTFLKTIKASKPFHKPTQNFIIFSSTPQPPPHQPIKSFSHQSLKSHPFLNPPNPHLPPSSFQATFSLH